MHGAQLDLIESYGFRAPVPEQVELVGSFHDRFQRIGRGVIAIGSSKVALDRYFRGAITIKRPDLSPSSSRSPRRASRRSGWRRSAPTRSRDGCACGTTSGRSSTSAPEDRYQEMSLYEEWKAFPLGRHDDRLDGLDMLIRTAREFEIVGDQVFDLEVLDVG